GLSPDVNAIIEKLALRYDTDKAEIFNRAIGLLNYLSDAASEGKRVGTAAEDQELDTEIVGIYSGLPAGCMRLRDSSPTSLASAKQEVVESPLSPTSSDAQYQARPELRRDRLLRLAAPARSADGAAGAGGGDRPAHGGRAGDQRQRPDRCRGACPGAGRPLLY